MRDFNYVDKELFCEGVSLKEIAKENATPFYVYSHKTVMDHFNKLKNAFSEIDPLICFSMKSNSNLNICRSLVKAGSGLDIVSGGELYRALKAGCAPEKIVYACVWITEVEIVEAIKKVILFFNVESIPELVMIDSVSRRMNTKPSVALRVNPDVKAKTHDFITTGTKEKKFGIDFKTAEDIFDNANKYSNVLIEGIHVHIGSQITDPEPFVSSITRVLEFIEQGNINIKYLNLGGGFGIDYGEEKAKTADELAAKIVPLLKDKPYKIILEPGRFIVGNAGVLICKILYIKTTSFGKKFAIVDAGMNDLIRPSLYDAYHEVLPLVESNTEKSKYDLVGPICESGDYIALDRDFPELAAGEYLAVMSAGAYGAVMSSNYNSRPKPAEIIVAGDEAYLVRKRETYKDLIAKEKMIKEFK